MFLVLWCLGINIWSSAFARQPHGFGIIISLRSLFSYVLFLVIIFTDNQAAIRTFQTLTGRSGTYISIVVISLIDKL
ncbi:hypothetical protein B0J14DRAFT_496251 [Halenospora varia]|nr:hypothetical protein B0J14DRAFT_496251 [Halenospora varia]